MVLRTLKREIKPITSSKEFGKSSIRRRNPPVIADEVDVRFEPHDIDVYHIKHQFEKLTFRQRIKFIFMISSWNHAPYISDASIDRKFSVDLLDKYLLSSGKYYIKLVPFFWNRDKLRIITSRPHHIKESDIDNIFRIKSVVIERDNEILITKYPSSDRREFARILHEACPIIFNSMEEYYL